MFKHSFLPVEVAESNLYLFEHLQYCFHHPLIKVNNKIVWLPSDVEEGLDFERAFVHRYLRASP